MSKKTKGKDPAFLFYPNDWIGGTMGMTFEEKGAYMQLLMMQFNRGHMTSHMIAQTVGQLWVNLKDKFTQDKQGLWYNERLEEEKQKRKAFTASRFNNLSGKNQYTKNTGHKKGHMSSHMENEDVNVNESINKDGNVSEYEIIEYPAFSDFWDMYDKKRGDVGKIKSKWSKLTQSEKEAIIDYLPAYIASTPDKKFRKDPLTFLNNKSWNDEIITENKPGRKPIAKLEISDFD
jgi:uncharacterized protein YdaU (DUF1376 family)